MNTFSIRRGFHGNCPYLLRMFSSTLKSCQVLTRRKLSNIYIVTKGMVLLGANFQSGTKTDDDNLRCSKILLHPHTPHPVHMVYIIFNSSVFMFHIRTSHRRFKLNFLFCPQTQLRLSLSKSSYSCPPLLAWRLKKCKRIRVGVVTEEHPSKPSSMGGNSSWDHHIRCVFSLVHFSYILT